MNTMRRCSSGCGSSIPTTYTRKAASARTPRKSCLTTKSSCPSSSRTKLTGELVMGRKADLCVRDDVGERGTRSRFRQRRTTRELTQRGVAHVLKGGDADFAG